MSEAAGHPDLRSCPELVQEGGSVQKDITVGKKMMQRSWTSPLEIRVYTQTFLGAYFCLPDDYRL